MRQALHMNPGFPDGHLELGMLLAERGVRGDEPEQCYDEAIRLAPGRPEPWFLLGHRLLGRGAVEEAERAGAIGRARSAIATRDDSADYVVDDELEL